MHLTDDVLLFVRGRARPPAPPDARRQRDRRLGDRGGELLAGGGGDRDRAQPMTSCRARGCVHAWWPRDRHAAAVGTVSRQARRRRSVDPRLAAEVAGGRACLRRARAPPGARRQDRRTARARGDGLRAALRRRADVSEIVVTAPGAAALRHARSGRAWERGASAASGWRIESPRVVVRVRPRSGDEVVVLGAAGRPRERRSRSAHGRALGIGGGVEVDVREAIPPHMGLGSGTKLGLAIARGLAELAGIAAGPGSWRRRAGAGRARASASGRLRRPGWWSRPACADGGSVSPLVARHPIPERVAVRAGAATRRRGAVRGCRAALFRSAARIRTAIEPRVVAAAVDRAAARIARGRHRRVRRRADRDPARDRLDVRHPAGRRVPSARGSGRRCAAGARRRSGRPELWGPSVYGIVDGPSAPSASRIGCARQRARTSTSAWSTSIAGARRVTRGSGRPA